MGQPEDSPPLAGVAAWSQSGNTLYTMWPRLTDQALELGDEVTTFADLLLLGITTGIVDEAIGFAPEGVSGPWSKRTRTCLARSCSSRPWPSVAQEGSRAGRTCGPGWKLVCSRWTNGKLLLGVFVQIDAPDSPATEVHRDGLDSHTFPSTLCCR